MKTILELPHFEHIYFFKFGYNLLVYYFRYMVYLAFGRNDIFTQIILHMLTSPTHLGEVYLKQHYVIKFVSGFPGTLVSSTNKTDLHDITEILLNVALNTINQPSFLTCYFNPEQIPESNDPSSMLILPDNYGCQVYNSLRFWRGNYLHWWKS
jgi:hypothetical protein